MTDIRTSPDNNSNIGATQGCPYAANRIYGGQELPDGGRDSTYSPVFKDPATQHLDDDPNRKPVVIERNAQPLEGTTGEQTQITKLDEAGEEATRVHKGRTYKIKKDEDGFPIFTIMETYLDRSHINSGDDKAHFEAASKRVKDLL